MNHALLHTDVQEFIRNNLRTDLYALILKESPFPDVSSRELAEQIASRKKAEKKLPTWFSATSICFPDQSQLGQSSSEACAAHKAGIIPADTVFDLTGGFGVDTYYFSKSARRVVYCETDHRLAKIASHNFSQLGADNIQIEATDGMQWLQEVQRKAALIYLDPSRRTQTKKRVFMLSDCLPDVPRHLDLLFDAAPRLLIKTSPLLDLRAGLKELGPVKEIHIVARNNEVKEVLWLLETDYKGEVLVKSANLDDASHYFEFLLSEEKGQQLLLSSPRSYVYEPNAAILKSGGFKTLGVQLGLPKLHEHSHLYTSESLDEFPGRRFKIIRTRPYSRKGMQELNLAKANISTRNFPQTVATIRNRFRIADGGATFLFFTKGPGDELIVIECEKI